MAQTEADWVAFAVVTVVVVAVVVVAAAVADLFVVDFVAAAVVQYEAYPFV